MPESTTNAAVARASASSATCTCGASSTLPSAAERGRGLLRLDRAVDTGQVTPAEAAERRVQLLAR